ncbi:nitronate monooxygenase|uniref:nitronate monooxygenase n=1 Tax=Pseudomonas sp. SbOxS1 TaxID=2723884 RepID=UPI0015D37D40|nr:nitronate monooxygenase [Pseudomonas sp. SbOxS1]NYU03312.1 nitronate monooxygenase [Pseudomonas sp. SbOxS1]
MKTKVCEMLSIDLPIFAFSHCRDVVAEVSRAGGMGVLGVSGFTPEQLEQELTWIDEHIDGKPYAVDILIPNKYAASGNPTEKRRPELPAENQLFLKKLCDDAGIAPLPETEVERMVSEYMDRLHMTPESAEELIEVALRHPLVKLVVNALGTPPKEKVRELQARGVKVGSLVGRLDHAKAQVEAGVDLLVAQGSEAGGHTGTITSMVLWPQVVDAVAPIPVLAAGGIGRGRQMAAALAMGADGIWCGSIWLGTDKSELTPEMKARLFAARSEEAIQSRAMTGKPCRMLRSKFTDAFEQPGAPKPLAMPLQTLSVFEARARIERARASDFLTHPVGQIVGDMHGETTVKEIFYDLLSDFLDSAERLATLVASLE